MLGGIGVFGAFKLRSGLTVLDGLEVLDFGHMTSFSETAWLTRWA